jgi:hypothetical protein
MHRASRASIGPQSPALIFFFSDDASIAVMCVCVCCVCVCVCVCVCMTAGRDVLSGGNMYLSIQTIDYENILIILYLISSRMC